jgi:hypothetical protein
MIRNSIKGLILALTLAAGAAPALAQGTAFTYQGELQSSGSPVNTPADFQFSLFTAATGGTQVGSTVTHSGVTVSSGLFTTPVDFGVNPYTSNQALFLEIAVRNPAGSGSFVTLGSRQLLTPTPFSLATRGINVNTAGDIALLTGTNRTISVPNTPFNANGTNLTIVAGNGNAENIATEGGDLILEAGRAFNGDQSFIRPGDVFIRSGGNQISAGNAPNGGDIIMQTGGANSAVTERMRVTQSGNVGIGTAIPGNRLSVAGTADFTGNVGIGTTTPAAPLDVMGNLRVFSNGTIRNQAVASTFGSHNGLIETFYGPNDRFGMAQLPAGKLALYSGDVFSGSAVQIGTMTGASAFSPSMTVARGGNVGIGTVDPTSKLHVIGDAQLNGDLRFGDQTWNGTTGNAAYMFQLANATLTQVYMNMDSSDIGAFFLRRNGTVVYSFFMDGDALKPGGGTWAVLSDERTKTDIQPMTGTLDRLLQLRGHAYSYKPEFVENGRALPGTQIGLVAQEVEAVFPDWISTGPDGMKQVTERSTTALMVEALRDLRAEKDAEINALKARLEKLEALLSAQASQQK